MLVARCGYPQLPPSLHGHGRGCLTVTDSGYIVVDTVTLTPSQCCHGGAPKWKSGTPRAEK
eukprot:3934226-Rhodomonas_salina.3